ncbi:Flp pilus assembly protein CpaB [Elioraea tepidiphila]|jgi:pilus assembly protein CpaB|uniref:Flp pilus assembly protein CpaB n=1 Tax=Elioraea tepidiphila TaxID=457934 RepID=UPI002FDA1F17
MAVRIILIGLIVLAAAGLSLLGMQALLPAQPARTVVSETVPNQPPPPLLVRTLVAARPIPAGSLLRAEDLGVREVPTGEAGGGVLRDTPETRAELAGALVRRYLEPGERIAIEDVLRPRDRGFLAAVLRPNMRAITVGVDAVTGTAGLIWPGDRVDLLLTQSLDERVTQLSRRVVGETVLNDVRVIAVDQQLTQGAAGANASPEGRVARTVTLEVTPEEAERVAVAGQLGRLSLTIRAMDGDSESGERARRSVFGGDVSPALSESDRIERPVGARMRIIQGDDRQEVIFR